MKLTSGITTPTRRAAMKKQMIDTGYPLPFVEEAVDLAFLAVDRSVEAVSAVCGTASQAIVMIQAQTMATQLLAAEFDTIARVHVSAMEDISAKFGDAPVDLVSSDPKGEAR